MGYSYGSALCQGVLILNKIQKRKRKSSFSMDVKVEQTNSSLTVSPRAEMTTLATHEIDRRKAFKILEGVFPFDEYTGAITALSYISSSTVLIGTLFDVTTRVAPHHSRDHYMSRLIGRLCMEKFATYEDLVQLSNDSVTLSSVRVKKLSEHHTETYHMRSCYCQIDEEESESDDDE